ncbi:hypothetical protein I3842_03G211700 [Carya illinoinensis]|uniref:RNA-dependent RNA polymerase n=1 Tax=Carya illinoinensis TaxID=32201 RepID=A0A922FQ06_CARIL|nr:hypothetical protein I3842_03G211700 [Carya illinoinensis]
MENIVMHFGNQVSGDSFFVLWKQEDVSGRFDFRNEKLYFYFSHLSEEYKFEISYENISKIELYRQRGQATKFILIQLRGAPRIYVKDESDVGHYEWLHWPIYALCLELPKKMRLSKLHLDDFVHYKEIEGQFELMERSPYSCSSGLVPIVNPPTGFNLPYKILFKINSLIQHEILPGPTIVEDLYRLVDPTRIEIQYIESALDKLFHLKDYCYEPVKWLKEQYKGYASSTRFQTTRAISLDDGLVYIHRVQVTPSKVYFCGPEVNLSNRVLRHYPKDIDNFLRVSFVDEDLDKMRSITLSLRSSSENENKRTRVYDRILSTLRNGIVIGDKKFEFLAYSSSQEKIMFGCIRESLGDFRNIRNVAKYGARLGQSFSSSRETASVGIDEIEIIPDVEVKKGQVTYCFPDGIGKISAELAREVATKLGCSSVPSAFQIRYAGYKGVVAVDPTSSVKLSLKKKSMCKYKSRDTKLKVLAWITLLSNLGVKDPAFQEKQREAIYQLNAILTDPLRAQEALDMMMFAGEISNVLKEMLICGYKPDAEPFLSMMLQPLRASKLMDMRLKTRIFIPKWKSFDGMHGRNQDIGIWLILKAVDVPALYHMVDCVVFPQKGKRPLPNECSGSDLDGDTYFVSWDLDLIPPRDDRPMEYNVAPTLEVNHDVTIEVFSSNN